MFASDAIIRLPLLRQDSFAEAGANGDGRLFELWCEFLEFVPQGKLHHAGLGQQARVIAESARYRL